MKQTIVLCILFTLTTHLGFGQDGPEWIVESESELSTTADLNNDGRPDVVVVDRESGSYRIGYLLAQDTYQWAEPRVSGIRNVTGFTVGKLLATDKRALAFTSPDANRITVISAEDTSVPGIPQPVFLPSIGPVMVTAIEMGGAGNTAFEDYFVASVLGTHPVRYTALRNLNGSATSVLRDAPFIGNQIAFANKVQVKIGTPPSVGVMIPGSTDEFVGLNFPDGLLTEKISLPGLPAGSRYAYGQFNSSNPLAQLITYKPTQKSMFIRQVIEPTPDTFSFSPPQTINLPENPAQILVLRTASEQQILVLYENRDRIALFDFNGQQPPSFSRLIIADPGQSFTSIVASPDGRFVALTGVPGTDRSTGFRAYQHDGSRYKEIASGELPSLETKNSSANVFQFNAEPFVSPQPRLVRALNAGDWSSDFNINSGQVQVSAERYENSANGLDGPTVTGLGPVHPDAAFGLVNQYADSISVFSTRAALGDVPSDVTISPQPGRYEHSIQISFQSAEASDLIFYRATGDSGWSAFNGTPFTLFADRSIVYYGQKAGTLKKSAIQRAAYTFAEGPDDLDSDKDGVPDYVEADQGLDPLNSGNDGDKDGYSDLEELVKGSNPNDPASTPAGQPGLEQNASFDLAVTVRPWDGFSNFEESAHENVDVTAHTLTGALLGNGSTRAASSIAGISNLLADADQKLLVLSTPAHFRTQTARADDLIGREMIGLVPYPAIPSLEVPYTYGSQPGGNAAQADRWIASATSVFNNVNRPIVPTELTVQSTLSTLLTERRIALILEERELAGTTNLTITPFRINDAARRSLGPNQVASLQSRVNNHPAYDLATIFAFIEQSIETTPTSAIGDLVKLAQDIYGVSSVQNNSNPGVYPLPFDVIREFILSGNLHSAYAAEISASQNQLDQARSAVSALLGQPLARPFGEYTLRVRADSFTGPCTILETANLAATPFYLFDAQLNPYPFPDSFVLPVGSEVRVRGFTDLDITTCGPGTVMEVVSLAVDALPVASDPDNDGNLLIDSWEKLFFGSTGGSAFRNSDNDPFSDLQEMWEGSDPTDTLGIPSVPPENLAAPIVNIVPRADGRVDLNWTWPSRYTDRVQFDLIATDTVDGSYVPIATDVSAISGNYNVTVQPAAVAEFYAVTVRLR